MVPSKVSVSEAALEEIDKVREETSPEPVRLENVNPGVLGTVLDPIEIDTDDDRD